MKKTPVLDEEVKERIDGYAEAIKNFGLQKLLNKLIDAKILGPEYSYNTFKTQFRRLKENKTGPFLKPNFLYPILEHLDGFTYKDLFGEDETGKNESKNQESNEYLLNAFFNLETEVKKSLSVLHKDSRSANPRDYIKGKDLLESAREIAMHIGYMFNNNSLGYYALINIFVQYTLPKKKTWKHGDSSRLSRIDGILEQLLQTTNNIFLFNEEGYFREDFRSVNNNLSIRNMLLLGNFYLVIAYQILLIEELYKLYSKNFKIIEELKNEKTGDVSKESKIRVEIIRKISIEKEYDDTHGDNFRNCIKKFNTIFDSRLESYYGLVWGFSVPNKKDIPSSEYLNGLQEIILFLHNMLVNFINPIEKNKPHGFGGYEPLTTFERLVRIDKIEKNQVVHLSNEDLSTFGELISFFEKLEYQKPNTEQDEGGNLNETDKLIKQLSGVENNYRWRGVEPDWES